MFIKGDKRRGGAALEYLVVTIFASVIALGVMALSGNIIKQKLSQTLSNMGIDAHELDFNFLDLE